MSRPSTERCGTKSPQPKFKYKRNKIQYELNEKVLDTLEVAASASDEKARNGALEEGKKILKERNKHILLAEKYWREQAIRIFTYMYLDDGAGAGKSLDTARAASKKVREDAAASGFVAHPEKCSWEPTQVGELLGFILNLREGIMQVPL